MNRQYLNPLGFIDKITDTGATIILTNPKDSEDLKQGTSVTIWTYSRGLLAMEKLRGRITRIGHTTAALEITGREATPRWPEGGETLKEKTPVYLALEDSFEPDLRRMLTPEQVADMAKLARRYAELTGLVPKEPDQEKTSGTDDPP